MYIQIVDCKRRRQGTLTVSGGPYKAGDPAPEGYIDREEWADAQAKAGLKQVRCCRCSRWKFPQQLARFVTEESVAYRSKRDAALGRNPVVSVERVPICLECELKEGT